MRKRKFKMLFITVLSLSLTTGVVALGADSDVVLNEGERIFVSNDGNDKASGTEAKPFATIEKAQARAALYKKMGREKITIYLRGGEYGAFSLGVSESGDDTTQIIYKAYPGEEVRINVGATLENPIVADDSVTARIPESARASILTYDLSGINSDWPLSGMENGENIKMCSELYLNGASMRIARWPNEGYFRISGMGTVSNQVLTFSDPQKPSLWKNNSNAWVAGFRSADWDFVRKSVTDITDSSLNLGDAFKKTSRIYFYNIPEELDQPGEYYIDKTTKKLYFYPPEGAEGKRLVLSLGDNAILVQRCQNISFEDLIIEGAMGNGIYIEYSDNVNVKNCIIRNCGVSGVVYSESKNSVARDNHVYNVGACGMRVMQYTYLQELIEGNVLITNNRIHDFGKTTGTYAPGIKIEGVSNTVSHNEIYNYQHTGIMFSGNENIFEYNDIHDILTATNDAGAIYCGRTWISRGNILRYNYIHDCVSNAGKSIIGIYLDDMMADVTCYGNIIDNVSCGFLLGGGHDNVITNNIIANTKGISPSTASISADSRGTEKWYAANFDMSGGKVYRKDCTYIKEFIDRHCLTSNAWLEKYPNLRDILSKDFREPQNNTITNNIIYKHNAISIADNVVKNGKVQNNKVFTENPGFTDPENGDYSFSGEIPAGFLPIPCEKIGIIEG